MMRMNRLFPVSPMNALQTLDRVLETLDPLRMGSQSVTPAFPALNVWEDGESLYAEAEVPGLKMEDIDVLITGNELTIKGRRATAPSATGTFHRQERSIGEFTRIVTLPHEINAAKVEATLKDGVLTIVLPRAEQGKARRIAVKSA